MTETRTPAAELHPDPANRRTHGDRNREMTIAALRQLGAARSIVIDEDDVILAGNGVTAAAIAAGITSVRVIESDGTELIAVRRRGLSVEQKRALALYDNRTSELAEWNAEQFISDRADGLDFEPFFFEHEIAGIVGKHKGTGRTEPDDTPAMRATAIKLGDVFELGAHVLVCGDSSNANEVRRAVGDTDPDLILTDPPYCSGGFQEAGRASGSIGTRSDEMIHNDTLSTRGYIALMKAVVAGTRSKAAYVFTDWRMWLNLFDVMESSGYGVRNMIVWDKGTPGMGAGWRMQHELVMAALTSRAPRFDPHVAQGNVIQAQRTGNVLHPTQKPVDLLEKILRVSNWARVIVDPFAGAGSTLIAAETVGVSCRALELSPGFCQVTIDRWEAFTGNAARKVAEL